MKTCPQCTNVYSTSLTSYHTHLMIFKFIFYGFIAFALLISQQLNAQHLTLKGQTGAFPTIIDPPQNANPEPTTKLQPAVIHLANEPRTLQGYSGEVISVAFSPDRRTLASGSANKTIKMWDVSDLRR